MANEDAKDLTRPGTEQYRRAIATSAVGLAAIIAAAFSGAAFVSNGQDGASMAMAVLTGVAVLCYLANLLMVGPAAVTTPATAAVTGPATAAVTGPATDVSPATDISPAIVTGPAAEVSPAAAVKE